MCFIMWKRKNWTCDCGNLVFILLGVLQQTGSVLSSGVVLGMAQPALSVVLHPVGSVAVAQQEAVGRLSPQQQSGSWKTEELGLSASSSCPVCSLWQLRFNFHRLAAHLCCLHARHRSSWRVCPAWFPLNLLAARPPPPSATGGLEPRPSWPAYAPVVTTESFKSNLTIHFDQTLIEKKA